MVETTEAVMHRIAREFDVFSTAFDRYMERVDDAVCELDETLFERARPLIADAVDVSLFIRDAGYLIEALRRRAKG